MISEAVVYRLMITCDAIPPAGLHCDVSAEFSVPVDLTDSVFNPGRACMAVSRQAKDAGWVMIWTQPKKYPDGRYLCPTCGRRWPKVKWSKRA